VKTAKKKATKKAPKKPAAKKTAAKKKGHPWIIAAKTVKVTLSPTMVLSVERLHARLKKIDPKLGLAELLRVIICWGLIQHENNRKLAAAKRRSRRGATRAIAGPTIAIGTEGAPSFRVSDFAAVAKTIEVK
jgi:hypothetical protein